MLTESTGEFPADNQNQNAGRATFASGLQLHWRGSRPLTTNHLRRNLLQLGAKRALDIFVSAILIVLCAPFMLAICLAVRIDSPGPIFFVQAREGLFLKSFRILKFRTLRIEHADPSGISQVARDDDRTTRVGRLLRRTSLDELPQLFNIFVGDMSLVGPRPHVRGMLVANQRYTDLVKYYRMRRLARPGLTGWAQANGLRGPTVDAEHAIARVDHDIAYIQNFSFWLDLRILFITAIDEIRHLGRGH